MTLDFVVLCLAGFGLVSALSSALVYVALPFFDWFADGLRHRHRARLWAGLSLVPLGLGAFALAASFFPAWGLVPDHCLDHGAHHPHLCPHHLGMGNRPGFLLYLVAVWVAVQAARGALAVIQTALSSRSTRSALIGASRVQEGMHVFPGDAPEAFVVGLLRPRVFMSQALLALGREISEPVLAHERAHVKHRDGLWRAAWPLMTIGHHAPVVSALLRRLSFSQEMAADEDGARSLPEGRLKMAHALVSLAKRQPMNADALAFTDGDVSARVRALMEPPRNPGNGATWLLLVAALLLPIVVSLSHDVIHHELETLLGSLS